MDRDHHPDHNFPESPLLLKMKPNYEIISVQKMIMFTSAFGKDCNHPVNWMRLVYQFVSLNHSIFGRSFFLIFLKYSRFFSSSLQFLLVQFFSSSIDMSSNNHQSYVSLKPYTVFFLYYINQSVYEILHQQDSIQVLHCALNIPTVLYLQKHPLDWDILVYHLHFTLAHQQPLYLKSSSLIPVYFLSLKFYSSGV